MHNGVKTSDASASSEKYTLTHSCHTSVCFVAVTWDQLQSGPQSDTEQDETEPPPPGTTIGETYHNHSPMGPIIADRAVRQAAGPEPRLLPFYDFLGLPV